MSAPTRNVPHLPAQDSPGAPTQQVPTAAAHDVSLSLVSHTNVGKTTLARTLLKRDVGEVRDAPHVTEFADAHPMIETTAGERLVLWDTPGFGDSGRLLKRLRQSTNPIGWFLAQVWDRWRDRPFWASQQALRNVREQADVMLYLVNAAESPEAAGYVEPEMALLEWLAKPVVVLLNQLGAPRGAAADDAEVARWRAALARWPRVGAVLPLDAFARCWVQELVLLDALEAALAGEPRERMARLRAAWVSQGRATFDAAMRAQAEGLARIALDAEPVPEGGGLVAKLRSAGAALGLGDAARPDAGAQQALAERLERAQRDATLALLRLHGLAGEVQRRIHERVATHYRLHLRIDEKGAAVWGGAISGALAGLATDVMSGGLTLGGGLLAGGLLGALGGAGLARGMNVARGTERSWIAWTPEALDGLVRATLLRYLAVAHFGRGRGDWAEGESPPHWGEVVEDAVAPLADALAAAWSSRPPPGAATDADRAALAIGLARILHDAAAAALVRLYPVSRPIFEADVDADADSPEDEATRAP
jgi:hypothetical protein